MRRSPSTALTLLLLAWPASSAPGQVTGDRQPVGCPDPSRCPVNIPADQVKWGKIFPEMGPDGPDIAILHVDPKTQATQLMIRTAKAMPVPWHWHSAAETHTVLSGTFTVECEGKKAEFAPGSFNYLPARAIHRAWTTEGCTLFITVDSAWDLHWVEGPPAPPRPGEAPPPIPASWKPEDLRWGGVVIEAMEIAEATAGHANAHSKRITDRTELRRLIAALEPRDSKPSGSSMEKCKWVVTLFAGQGGFLNQIWVMDDGDWGYAGACRGTSSDLPRVLSER